jgi:tetratricopeptide (TPR) repeat protein
LAVFGLCLLALALVIVWRMQLQGGPQLTQVLDSVSAGDFTLARRRVHELRRKPNHESELALVQGAMLLQRGHFLLAIDHLKQAAEDPRFRKLARIRLGEAWYRLGRHLEAQDVWEQVLQEDKDNLAAHRWLAATYYDLGAVQHALGHLERVAQLDPEDPRPHRLLGLINKDYERYEEAVPCYRESLRRKADQPAAQEIKEELAECLCRLQNHRGALEVLETSSHTTKTTTLAAECRHALGEIPSARDLLKDAFRSDASNLDALLLQGTMLMEEKQAEAAVAVFEKAVQAHPKDFTARFKLSQAYAQAGNEASAKEAGKVAEEIRKVRKEFADLHQVAWDNPLDPQVRLRLAALAKDLNRPDLAAVWIKSANALLPPPDSATPSPK